MGQWEKYTGGVNREFSSLDKAVVSLIVGLITDGEDQKQGALEAAFRALCDDAYVDRAKKFFNWKEGQP